MRNAAAIAEVVKRVGWDSLALELAAARVSVSPQQLAQRLDQRFRVLAGGERGPSSVTRRCVPRSDWSYDMLDTRPAMSARSASVFAGGCSLDVAEAAAPATGSTK